MATKTTQPAPKIITHTDALKAAKSYLEARLALDAIENTISKEVAKIRNKYQDGIGVSNDVLYEADQMLRAYGEQEQANWPGRSFDLVYCKIGYRAGSKKVMLEDGMTDTDALLALKSDKALAKVFVATVESLDKKAVLGCKSEALLNQLTELTGIYVGRDPDKFNIDLKKEDIGS